MIKNDMGLPERKIIASRLNNLESHERRFRANSGMGWTGELVSHRGDTLILKNPRPFHGMPEGTPDLIGWDSVEITTDMIGQRLAVFVGEEVKASGKLRKKQDLFGRLLVRMGGIFRVLRS